MTCDYTVGLRILDDDGTTSLFDFNDRANGYCVETVQLPEESVREIRASAPRVDGSALLAWSYEDGVLTGFLHCHGSTWAEVTSRWETARAVYRGRTRYLLEVEIDGATVTFRAERPFSVVPTEVTSDSLTGKRQTYTVRWRVQPDPTVTPTEES